MSDADENKCFTFWENWFLLAEGRDTDEKRLAFYDALFRFAFDGEVPPKPRRGDPGTVWAAYDAYLAASQTISRNMDLREQGRRGGQCGKGISRNVGNQHARKSTEEESDEPDERQNNSQNKSQNKSQTKADSEASTKANNIKENKINENKIKRDIGSADLAPDPDVDLFTSGWVEDETYGGRRPVLPSPDLMRKYAHDVNVPESYVEKFLAEMRNCGWGYVNRGGSTVTLNQRNFKYILKSFYDQHQRNLESDNAGRSNGHREGITDGLGF